MADYTLLSRYDPDASIELVRYGANLTVLESELNEMQQTGNDKLRKLMRFIFSDGLSTLANMSYSSGTFAISNCYAIVDGVLLYISNATIAAADGNDIYLDTWVETATYTSTIRKYGNVQEAAITNYFRDPNIGEETARREIRKYALSTTNAQANHNYLWLGRISTGALQKKAKLIVSTLSALRVTTEEIFTSTANQTIFNLTLGEYVPGLGQLDVYLNGTRIPRSAFTETSSTRFTLKAANLPAGIEVVAIYG